MRGDGAPVVGSANHPLTHAPSMQAHVTSECGYAHVPSEHVPSVVYVASVVASRHVALGGVVHVTETPWHTPFEHVSDVVQASPSSHDVPLTLHAWFDGESP